MSELNQTESNLLQNIQTLRDHYGTPLYIYDKKQLLQTCETIQRAHAHVDSQLLYFEAANRNPAILNIVKENGFGICVVRPAGVDRALQLGFAPSDIECSGFGFSRDELRWLKSKGVTINLASESEVAVFAEQFPDEVVSIRVDLNELEQVDKRGIPIERIFYLVNKHKIRLAGLHMYLGTNLLDHQEYGAALDKVSQLISDLPNTTLSSLEYLNVGGGFGHDYHRRVAFDWKSHGDQLKTVTDCLGNALNRPIKIKCEVGRALVASSGFLLCKILHAYDKNGQRFVAVDTNISHFGRPVRYGFDNQFFPFMTEGYHQFLIIDRTGTLRRPQCTSGLKVAIVGNSHYSKDWLGITEMNACSPELLVGGYVLALDAGAYIESMSDHWADEPRPAVVMIDGGSHQLVSSRETYADLIDVSTAPRKPR